MSSRTSWPGLFERYRMRLSSKLTRQIGAALESEFGPDDVLSESYISAETRWHARPTDPEKDYVWLYGIVHEQFYDMLRKVNAAKRGGQIKEVRIPDNSAAEIAMELWQSQTGASTNAARNEFVSRLRELLERHLATIDVEVFLMRVLDRLEYPEIVAEFVRRAEESDRRRRLPEDPRRAAIQGRMAPTGTPDGNDKDVQQAAGGRHPPAIHPCRRKADRRHRRGVPRAPRRASQPEPGEDLTRTTKPRGNDDDVLIFDRARRTRTRSWRTLREELIEAVEQGPAAVEKTLAAWCARYPDREDDFRKEASAILLLWGLREPERLGPYQLLDVLTVGGMGKIYRAREDVTGRIVAVKTVLAGHLSPAEQVKRFDTERRLLSCLHDTHIVPLLATGQEGYLLYMVMPFIPGVTLKSVIAIGLRPRPCDASRSQPSTSLFTAASKVESKKRMDATHAPSRAQALSSSVAPPDTAGPSSPGRDRRPADYFRHVATMMEHVAGAVQHIHDAKILHRDLKPSNIMIESSGHSWVIDIGLGRELDHGEDALPGVGPGPGSSRPTG